MNKVDYLSEPVLNQDRAMIEAKIKQLKQSDGEGWAIGESIQRILDNG